MPPVIPAKCGLHSRAICRIPLIIDDIAWTAWGAHAHSSMIPCAIAVLSDLRNKDVDGRRAVPKNRSRAIEIQACGLGIARPLHSLCVRMVHPKTLISKNIQPLVDGMGYILERLCSAIFDRQYGDRRSTWLISLRINLSTQHISATILVNGGISSLFPDGKSMPERAVLPV